MTSTLGVTAERRILGRNPSQATVKPGAYCSSEGAKGVISPVRRLVCKTTATDPKLRWRAA